MGGIAAPVIGGIAGGLGGLLGGSRTQPAGPLVPRFAGPSQDLILSMFGTPTTSRGRFGFQRTTLDPAQNLLANFGQRFGVGAGTAENFQGQLTPEQRTLGVALPQLLGLGTGDAFSQVEDAFRPIFERNIAAIQEQGGRFSTGNLQQRATAAQDFNAFLQQAAEQQRARQIQALTAAGQLGLGSQQLQTQALQPFLQALIGGGLPQGFIQQQSPLGGFFGGALQGAALGTSLQGQPPTSTPTSLPFPLPGFGFGSFTGVG